MKIHRLFRLAYAVSILLSSLSWAGQNAQEIQVHLPTESPLHPIYVSRLYAINTSLDAAYIRSLEAVLSYDLNYNAKTKVIASSPEREDLVGDPKATTLFNVAAWKNQRMHYVLKWHLSHRTIHATLLNVNNGAIMTWNDIALTGELNRDRRQIHKLADSICKTLFHVNGIAHSRILFAYQLKNPRSDGKEWVSEIWECDWDGANLRQITHENSYCVNPVLIPQGNSYPNDKFLYVSYKKGQPKIYIASLHEGKGERLIDLRGNQLLPAVSLQRDKIAFICDAAGRTDLFLQPLSASKEASKPYQLYSYPRSTQASPTFSPDGSKVAFVSDKDGSMRIYVISTALSEKRNNAVMISKQNRENSCPAWSPDGTKLAYSAKTNGVRQIWIYDVESKEEWQLTSGAGNKENPSWAPDSMHIIFNSTDDHSSELYIVNLNQPDALKITRGPGKKHYPTWGAR